MNEVTLPPTPNWYLSSIFACANDGTLAWGSNHAIIIVKRGEKRKILDYSIIPNAHSEKVNSVAFSPEYGQPEKNLLVSGGNEHIIKIWNLDTMTVTSSQTYLDTKQKVIDVDWSKSDPDLVCSISTEGSLISWNTRYSVCQTISLGKMTATCLACCPHKSNIVAIGTKVGLVYIVNLQGTGNIIYKMRGHDVDITSLSWCPIDINIFNKSNDKDLLLASGAKDKSIFIWRAGKDGRYETRLALPHGPQDSHHHRTKLGSSACHFTIVHWLKPKYLLATTVFGELLYCDLSISMGKYLWKVLHGNHTRILFSIASVPVNHDKSNEDWRSDDKLEVWTSAQDRQLVCSIVEKTTCNIEYSIPTHGGYIYCIASCPLDSSRIAYGGGDALLRLWNLSETHENKFDITNFWQKIRDRVMSIAWHPEQENLLALGTSEGRVEVFDTNNINKPPILFREHHLRAVYTLGWGPHPSKKSYALYSCGDHELVYYQHEKPDAAPTVLIKKDCTEFSWKPDLSCMAIGFEDGSISFVNNRLEPCGRPIFHLKKAVQCIAWHPDSTVTDLKYSPLKHYLAVGICDNTITIFDMTNMMNKMIDGQSKDDNNSQEIINKSDEIESNEKDNTVLHKVVGTLVGHVDRILCLAWSPHVSGYLVSGSYDNTAQVWNVKTQEIIGTYVGHCGPIYSCIWSPLDPDFIITGSQDFSLRIWQLSKQKIIPKEKLEIKEGKSKKSKKKNNKNNKNAINSNSETITTNIAKLSLTSSNDDNINNDHVENNIDNGTIQCESKESNKKEKRNKSSKDSLFSVYRKTMNDKSVMLASCLKLAKKTLDPNDNESISTDDEIPSIFGNKEDISKIINIEHISHVTHGQHMLATKMNIWSNNLRQQLQDAAKELKLNDFLVSLAPSLSVKMWQTMCECYAAQLKQESNPTKAVFYLLCIHKIHQAIEVFMESKMYREAYVLARSKLEDDDIIFNNILQVWAEAAIKMGQFEEAAQCCIKLGDLTKAAKLLARRKDIATLETAAQLAILAKNEELSESILDEAVITSLLHDNNQKCRDLIEKFPIIQYRLIHVEAAEELKKMRKLINDSHIMSWLEDKSNCSLLSILKKCHPISDSLEYNKLIALTNLNLPENEAMLWMKVSQEIALAVISPTNTIQIRHIILALGLVSQYEILHLNKSDKSPISFLIELLSILGTENLSVSSILANEIPIYKSLRAYMSLALLNWLVDNIKAQLIDEISVNSIIKIIEKLLVDGLNQSTVKYLTLINEISKLENLIASSIGNVSRDIENGESEENLAALKEHLETMHKDKEKFIVERVSSPSPVLIYSRANELASLLTDDSIHKNFTACIATAWKVALS